MAGARRRAIHSWLYKTLVSRTNNSAQTKHPQSPNQQNHTNPLIPQITVQTVALTPNQIPTIIGILQVELQPQHESQARFNSRHNISGQRTHPFRQKRLIDSEDL